MGSDNAWLSLTMAGISVMLSGYWYAEDWSSINSTTPSCLFCSPCFHHDFGRSYAFYKYRHIWFLSTILSCIKSSFLRSSWTRSLKSALLALLKMCKALLVLIEYFSFVHVLVGKMLLYLHLARNARLFTSLLAYFFLVNFAKLLESSSWNNN